MKKTKKVLITGSTGLIGSEAVLFFARQGLEPYGVDNDMRTYFFGSEGNTQWRLKQLKDEVKNYRHFSLDIRDARKVEELFKANRFALIIHAAAQPSHDWSAKEPFTDFSINATGTLNLLEQYRRYSPEAVFIFTSTNKVYGDRPNALPLKEFKSRFDLPKTHPYYRGIDEAMSIDQSLHSLFGASKLAADILVQEYGRYFHLPTVVFRASCLTGSAHSGVQLHGFLSYLVKAIKQQFTYTIFGYKGKQVRDNLHAADLAQAFYQVYLKPKAGRVYNIGGGRFANTSILEAIEKIESLVRKKAIADYREQPRIGDHQWYITDVTRFRKDYPAWRQTYTIDAIVEDIIRNGRFEEP